MRYREFRIQVSRRRSGGQFLSTSSHRWMGVTYLNSNLMLRLGADLKDQFFFCCNKTSLFSWFVHFLLSMIVDLWTVQLIWFLSSLFYSDKVATLFTFPSRYSSSNVIVRYTAHFSFLTVCFYFGWHVTLSVQLLWVPRPWLPPAAHCPPAASPASGWTTTARGTAVTSRTASRNTSCRRTWSTTSLRSSGRNAPAARSPSFSSKYLPWCLFIKAILPGATILCFNIRLVCFEAGRAEMISVRSGRGLMWRVRELSKLSMIGWTKCHYDCLLIFEEAVYIWAKWSDEFDEIGRRRCYSGHYFADHCYRLTV